MQLRSVSHTDPPPMPEVTMTPNERVELIASIIGCVLSNAFQMQVGLPHTPLHGLDPAVRDVYVALGRVSAAGLLTPHAKLAAEDRAVAIACDMLDRYDDQDERLGVTVDPFLRRARIKRAFLTALDSYTIEMSRRAQ